MSDVQEQPSWEEDFDFEEYEIEEVELDRENARWIVSLEYGLRVQWGRGRGNPQPRKGQTLRLYGVADEETEPRGMVVMVKEDQPRVLFYRTDVEHQLYLIQLEVAEEQHRRERYAALKDELAERQARLIRPLHQRIETLREGADVDPDWWNAAYLEQELRLSEHAMWTWMVEPDPIQMGIFLSLPNAQKISSVFSMLREQRKEEGDDRLAGVVFDPHLTPKEIARVRELATLLGAEHAEQQDLNGLGVFRPRLTVEHMIAALPEEARREALQESSD